MGDGSPHPRGQGRGNTRRATTRSLFQKSSPMIYAKHAKTTFDDLLGESMEYDLKVRHSCESRNPEGPILGEVRLMKQAPRVAPTVVCRLGEKMGPRIREDKGGGL